MLLKLIQPQKTNIVYFLSFWFPDLTYIHTEDHVCIYDIKILVNVVKGKGYYHEGKRFRKRSGGCKGMHSTQNMHMYRTLLLICYKDVNQMLKKIK